MSLPRLLLPHFIPSFLKEVVELLIGRQSLEGLHSRPCVLPPFGPLILPFELCLDQAATQNPRSAFNAGSLTDSIILLMPDFLAVAKPSHVFAFS